MALGLPASILLTAGLFDPTIPVFSAVARFRVETRDPLVKAIAASRTRLVERKFPVFYRELPNRGREYFDEEVLRELVRWIDALDKQ